MNQEKIGIFISNLRKENSITQAVLAEKLGVTDRSVSNWENGNNMPDLSLFKPLCEILGITINDLMSGEIVDNKKYNETFEENVINTIDYIDKKNNKREDSKNIGLLIAGCSGIVLSLLVLKESNVKDFMVVFAMILSIYGLNGLVTKYDFVKKIVVILVAISCMISLYFNLF